MMSKFTFYFVVALSIFLSNLARASDVTITDLGTLGGLTSKAIDINDNGQVLGTSGLRVQETHAIYWSSTEGLIDLGTLGGTLSRALDVNDAGQVVGNSYISVGSLESHAFIWSQADGMQDLGTLGGNYSSPVIINNNCLYLVKWNGYAGSWHPGWQQQQSPRHE